MHKQRNKKDSGERAVQSSTRKWQAASRVLKQQQNELACSLLHFLPLSSPSAVLNLQVMMASRMKTCLAVFGPTFTAESGVGLNTWPAAAKTHPAGVPGLCPFQLALQLFRLVQETRPTSLALLRGMATVEYACHLLRVATKDFGVSVGAFAAYQKTAGPSLVRYLQSPVSRLQAPLRGSGTRVIDQTRCCQ